MVPQTNNEQEKRLPKLYGLASLTSIISLFLASCGDAFRPIDTVQVPPNPPEGYNPISPAERFTKEGIGVLVENEFANAGTDFTILSKYLESMGFTVETAQEQWSSQSMQFQGETVHAVEAIAKTGEQLFIMTLASEGKTVMVTTIKGVDVDKDTEQTYDKMWTQQNFPMDKFLHLWGNVPKETQDRIIEEIFGTPPSGIPDEFNALRFASGHFLLLGYPDGNGGVIRDTDERIVGFQGGSVTFVGKDAAGNPILETGQQKLIWMPFVRTDSTKTINALFSSDNKPEVSDEALAGQLSVSFGVKITGFERTDAGFYAMSDTEHVLIFNDNKWQFFSLYTWETRDRTALNAPDTTVPYLNPETGIFDQIIDGSPDKIFANWNVEEGKWEVENKIIALSAEEKIFFDTVLPKEIKGNFAFDFTKQEHVELLKDIIKQYEQAKKIGVESPHPSDGAYFSSGESTYGEYTNWAFRLSGYFALQEGEAISYYSFAVFQDAPRFVLVQIGKKEAESGLIPSMIGATPAEFFYGITSSDSVEEALAKIGNRFVIMKFYVSEEKLIQLTGYPNLTPDREKYRQVIIHMLNFLHENKGSVLLTSAGKDIIRGRLTPQNFTQQYLFPIGGYEGLISVTK